MRVAASSGWLSERAQQVLRDAQAEAERHGRDQIGGEHILLSLLHQEEGGAAFVLALLGVTPDDILRHTFKPGDGPVLGGPPMPLSPRAQAVVRLADEEARRLNHVTVGTEHLLAGLAQEHDGATAGILDMAGAMIERVRPEIVRLHALSPEERLAATRHARAALADMSTPKITLMTGVDARARRDAYADTRSDDLGPGGHIEGAVQTGGVLVPIGSPAPPIDQLPVRTLYAIINRSTHPATYYEGLPGTFAIGEIIIQVPVEYRVQVMEAVGVDCAIADDEPSLLICTVTSPFIRIAFTTEDVGTA